MQTVWRQDSLQYPDRFWHSFSDDTNKTENTNNWAWNLYTFRRSHKPRSLHSNVAKKTQTNSQSTNRNNRATHASNRSQISLAARLESNFLPLVSLLKTVNNIYSRLNFWFATGIYRYNVSTYSVIFLFFQTQFKLLPDSALHSNKWKEGGGRNLQINLFVFFTF